MSRVVITKLPLLIALSTFCCLGCSSSGRTARVPLTNEQLAGVSAGYLGVSACALLGLTEPCAASVYDVVDRSAPTSTSCGASSCASGVSMPRSTPMTLSQFYESADTSVSQSQTVPAGGADTRTLMGQTWWSRQQNWGLRGR